MKTIRSFVAPFVVLAAGLFFAPDVVAAPEIQVLWNTTEIVDGDTTPSVADHTFFGVQTVGAGSIAQTFTIKNLGTQIYDLLALTGNPLVSIGGGNSSDFVVTAQPASAGVTAGATITFQVTWTPTFGGVHTANLAIPNNDSNENPYNFTISATAQLKLTYDAGYNGSISGATPQIVYSGASGSAVTAVPDANYHFVNWSDGSTANPRADTFVTQNLTVKANFAINTYTLNYTAGANGSLTGNTSQTRNYGLNGSAVTAVPVTGYHFVNWSDTSTANPRTDIHVTADLSVTANFVINSYTLNYTPDSNGMITGTTPQVIIEGMNGTEVTAVPATGYHFINWSDGSSTNPRTDTHITANLNVTANFRPKLFYASYYDGTEAPLTEAGFNATGATFSPNYALHYAPLPGTRLMLVNNTGKGFIDGTLDNLPNGAAVDLTYNDITYPFVAWYYGGDGNDLVLLWRGSSIAAWGWNPFSQIGDNSTSNRLAPVAVTESDVLAGKTVVSVAGGGHHSLALCADGTLAAWGENAYCQLGDNSFTPHKIPSPVTQNGALLNRTVVAIAAGELHSLALCSDGTVAAWGSNANGRIGLGYSSNQIIVPTIVTKTGVLSGKIVVAIAAGHSHNLVLCSDGTLAAWGNNADGQLGNNSTATSFSAPVAVTQSGVLAGKTVVAIAAGHDFSLALCSDGSLATWGRNGYGQLGNDSTAPSLIPVAVDQSGVLSGKTVVAIASGEFHSLALCSDGTLTSWGLDREGQLGDGPVATVEVPGAVNQSGVLFGKTIVAIAANAHDSQALCSDGTLAAWGGNNFGQLGDNSNNPRNVPVDVTQSGLLASKTVVGLAGSGPTALHSFAIQVPNAPTLIYTAGAHGTLTGITSQMVDYGVSGTAVTAVPAPGYHFVNWNDTRTANPRTDYYVTADVNVTANFAINTYTLSYTADANGSITGTSPQTIDHGTSGTAVTALANSGYSFVGWSDGSTATTRTDTNVTQNVSVTAQFAGIIYTLNYAAGPGGTLTGDTSQSVLYPGDGTSVTALADPGYSFVGWSDGLTANSRTETNVTQNVSVTAQFVGIIYTLDYAAGAGGTLTGDTSQSVLYPGVGTAVTAVPNSGYSFVDWSDGSTENPRTDNVMLANLSVTANFTINIYTLTYTAGANGSLTGTTPQTVDHGMDGTAVTAVPDANYHFVNWSDASTDISRTDIGVTAGLNVTANFAIDTYTLTYTADANGSLSGTTPQTVDHGADGTAVTAIPASDYRFTQWSDGSTDNPRTETNVTTDRSVTAYFVLTVLSFTSTPTDVTITDCDYQSASGALVIPGTINGLPVTSIGDLAFYNCYQLTSITIPASVTSIGDYAFHSCERLTSITIPASVTSIGDYAFHSCERLTSIMIPASVTSIGNYAFVNCYGLTSMTIPEGVTRIGNSLFFGCYQLASITIPSSVTSIGNYAFASCKLTSVTIPAGVTSIGVYAFQYCSSLTSISIPATVTSLGAGAFEDCSSLIQISVAGDSYGAGTHGTLSGPTPLPGSPGATGAAVTAVPDANYHFVNWSDSSTANPRTDTNETANLSVTANFAINMPAVLSAIAPPNGPIGGGTSVTITGTNLLDTTSVTFGGIEATIDSSSPTSLTVTSPAHAAGPVAVVVTTPSGSSNAITFTYDTPLQTWRQTWYGPTATNTGDAADNADPYGTGIPNLLVFAFLGPNQDPASAMISQVPQPAIAPGTFTYSFTEPAGVSGLTYGAEWSATMQPGDWQPVPDTGSAPDHLFSVPVDGARKFLRLTVE